MAQEKRPKDQYRCMSCNRTFNSDSELREHEKTCTRSQQRGEQERP